MPRPVVNTLIRSIYEPKDYTKLSSSKYYHTFLRAREKNNDGVSFSEVRVGHGRFIWDQSQRNFRRRQTREKATGFSFLFIEPDDFRSLFTGASGHYQGCLFSLEPDDSPAHVTVRLPAGARSEEDGTGNVVCVTLDDDVICDRADVDSIIIELSIHFRNQRLTVEECREREYFDDCAKSDKNISCCKDCPTPIAPCTPAP
jgi:hypothetical protein